MNIINESDPRYEYINDIFLKYNWDNIISIEGNRSIYCYIPPELVLTRVETCSLLITNDPLEVKSNEWNNWVGTMSLWYILNDSCRLTIQELFDLCILHINNTDFRPKCDQCGEFIPWSERITRGYGTGSRYWIDANHLFCSKSCASNYICSHINEYPNAYKSRLQNNKLWNKAGLEVINSMEYKAKNNMNKFINLGNPTDICYLYIAHDGINIKYGVTSNIITRKIFRFGFNNNLNSIYDNIHVIFSSNRLEVAYLEAIISLKLGKGELLEWNDLHKLIDVIKDILKSKITNPFNTTLTK